jgi:hypothetical protein
VVAYGIAPDLEHPVEVQREVSSGSQRRSSSNRR